ncbi:hypothetical protein Q0590_36410 [Rhodocytophaga aerolata]|uniref:Uncharacterized protein n=1 Tax=Rhodocytophaga aerolata TaxID=455078 RepID=A0ABT8RIA6_9BACT|nr:hypothetical protein [Rhodocytophaga aerolata]MDO1451815.1 hypothetical protein [Rhodocytophaga aerolata]
MDEIIKSLIEILREDGDDNIADLLINSRFNLIQSSTFGSRANSVISTAEIYSSPKLNTCLTRLRDDDKEKIKSAIFQIFPIQSDAPEIIDVLYKVDLRLQAESIEFESIPKPDFTKLGFSDDLNNLLILRWDESKKCVDAGAFLAGIIIMGSLLEGVIFGMLHAYPREANTAPNVPKNNGRVKPFTEWKLIEMIEVSHHNGWIQLDRVRFSHALREFRNLVHPSSQLELRSYPDRDTCIISWHVVQAACRDIINWKIKHPSI